MSPKADGSTRETRLQPGLSEVRWAFWERELSTLLARFNDATPWRNTHRCSCSFVKESGLAEEMVEVSSHSFTAGAWWRRRPLGHDLMSGVVTSYVLVIRDAFHWYRCCKRPTFEVIPP